MDTETFLLYTETSIITRVIFGIMEDFTAVSSWTFALVSLLYQGLNGRFSYLVQ